MTRLVLIPAFAAALALWWLYPLACAVIAGVGALATVQIWRRAARVEGGE